jgi:hypothetical protein
MTIKAILLSINIDFFDIFLSIIIII